EALRLAFVLAARTAGIGVPFALVFGLVSGSVTYAISQWIIGLQKAEAATVELYFELAAGAMVLTVLYAVLQISKAARVTRESWAPAMFAVPCTLLFATLWIVKGGSSAQMGPVAPSLLITAWALIWASFGGAAMQIAWLRPANNAIDGKP